MATPILVHCATCHKEFHGRASRKSKYCSKDCFIAGQKSGLSKRKAFTYIEFNCLVCKITFYDFRYNERKYCSLVCKHKAQRLLPLLRKKSVNPGKLYSCQICGKEFKGKTDASNKYCSRECYIAKGCGYFNCKVCGEKFKGHTGKSNKYCSSDCYNSAQTGIEYSGKNHPMWQGGSASLSYRGIGWGKIRREIIKRDGYKCRLCGITESESKDKYNRSLDVNHIIPFHQFGGKTQLANKYSNLESLCVSCHTKTDAKWRKENPVQLTLGAMFRR